MAEIVGLAASIIQIAGAGTKLSIALYNFTDSAVRADQDIKDIADDVELTSNALASVGEVFKTEDAQSIVSKKAIQDANNIIKKCDDVFNELSGIIEKRRKIGKDGKKMLSTRGRFSWPMKEQRVELSRKRLESLKNSLVLLLHVLQLAQGQARGKMETSAMETEREKIRELHQRQQDSLKSLQALESRFCNVALDDAETLTGSTASSRVPTVNFMLNPQPMGMPPLQKMSQPPQNSGTTNFATITDSETSDSDTTVTDEDDEPISINELAKCAAHVQKLLKRITVLQQSFESGQNTGRHRKKRVHKMYQRFCRRFETDMILPRLPLPSISTAHLRNIVPAGQTSNQLMNIGSQAGGVQITVDVEAASNVRDEKRERKPGGSAHIEEEERKVDFDKETPPLAAGDNMSMDFTLDYFGDNTPENFDFDSFLHAPDLDQVTTDSSGSTSGAMMHAGIVPPTNAASFQAPSGGQSQGSAGPLQPSAMQGTLSSSARKRGRPMELDGMGSLLPDSALKPNISPSIKPLLPRGIDGIGDDAHAHLLASTSNYQNILNGDTTGLQYPGALSTNLTSRRTSHKIAEQGRRNRINIALQELQSLLPPAQLAVLPQTQGRDSVAQDSPKAATVESAIAYIKCLKQGLGLEVNDQNIPENLPTLGPDTPMINLTSKRTSHKLVEQGRRNRINKALQELQALLPSTQTGAAPRAHGIDSTVQGQVSNSSKAATVEAAIAYIQELKQQNPQEFLSQSTLEKSKFAPLPTGSNIKTSFNRSTERGHYSQAEGGLRMDRMPSDDITRHAPALRRRSRYIPNLTTLFNPSGPNPGPNASQRVPVTSGPPASSGYSTAAASTTDDPIHPGIRVPSDPPVGPFQQAQGANINYSTPTIPQPLMQEHHQVYHSPHGAPVQDTDVEMHNAPQHYFQQMNPQQQLSFAQKGSWFEENTCFNQALSPAMISQVEPFQPPDFSAPGAYFSPLTSPALRAQADHTTQVQKHSIDTGGSKEFSFVDSKPDMFSREQKQNARKFHGWNAKRRPQSNFYVEKSAVAESKTRPWQGRLEPCGGLMGTAQNFETQAGAIAGGAGRQYFSTANEVTMSEVPTTEAAHIEDVYTSDDSARPRKRGRRMKRRKLEDDKEEVTSDLDIKLVGEPRDIVDILLEEWTVPVY